MAEWAGEADRSMVEVAKTSNTGDEKIELLVLVCDIVSGRKGKRLGADLTLATQWGAIVVREHVVVRIEYTQTQQLYSDYGGLLKLRPPVERADHFCKELAPRSQFVIFWVDVLSYGKEPPDDIVEYLIVR